MGTRHYQTVINKEGDEKIKQYGQWDGYPSGQGIGILKYLSNGDLDKYQNELDKITEISDDEIETVNEISNWPTVYPHLSRDCGSNIHQMIEDGVVPSVSYTSKEEANQWCEGFYHIDFNKNTFTSEFYGVTKSYSLDNLPTEEQYLIDMEDAE